MIRSLIPLLLVALPACGQSPLLHHVHSGEKNPPPGVSADSNDDVTPPSSPPAAEVCEIELPKTGLCASLVWIEKSIPKKKEGSFELKFRKKGSGELVDPPAKVGVVLWMPDMEHGSSPVTVERKGVGHYLATRVYFIMGGDWEIWIQVLKGEEEILDQGVLKVRM